MQPIQFHLHWINISIHSGQIKNKRGNLFIPDTEKQKWWLFCQSELLVKEMICFCVYLSFDESTLHRNMCVFAKLKGKTKTDKGTWWLICGCWPMWSCLLARTKKMWRQRHTTHVQADFVLLWPRGRKHVCGDNVSDMNMNEVLSVLHKQYSLSRRSPAIYFLNILRKTQGLFNYFF